MNLPGTFLVRPRSRKFPGADLSLTKPFLSLVWQGGGIFNGGGMLFLRHTVITNNTAQVAMP